MGQAPDLAGQSVAPVFMSVSHIPHGIKLFFLSIKGAVSQYSVIFCAFFARGKNGDCSRKCRGHQTMTARSAMRTASPLELSRENVVFLEQLSFYAALPCGRHYFSPHKMGAKNHRLSWHCRFNFVCSGVCASLSCDKVTWHQCLRMSHPNT